MAKKTFLDLTGLSRLIDHLKNLFASITHTHKKSDITDLVIDNSLSSSSTNPVQNAIVTAKLDALNDTISQKIQFITWEADD